MSLNYNYEACLPAIQEMIATLVDELPEDATKEDAEACDAHVYSIVDKMIWETISIDMCGYTEKNHDEVMKRIRFDEALFGLHITLVNSETKEPYKVPLPEEWVTLVHGMTVNVTDTMWTQYKNKSIRQWEREYTNKLEREKEDD